MKKLLLGAFLVVGMTAMASGYIVSNGEASYGNPSYRPFNNPNQDITINDNEDVVGLVRRFRRKGRGWKDTKRMFVKLTVHKRVRIKPEYRYIKGEGVLGDQLNFGDINYKLIGTMPATVKFKFRGPLFETSPLFVRATMKAPGIVTEQAEPGDLTKTLGAFPLDFNNYTQHIEMDLYFKLNEVSTSPYDKKGVVIATAKYVE